MNSCRFSDNFLVWNTCRLRTDRVKSLYIILLSIIGNWKIMLILSLYWILIENWECSLYSLGFICLGCRQKRKKLKNLQKARPSPPPHILINLLRFKSIQTGYSQKENPAILRTYDLDKNRTFHWFIHQGYISMREKGRVMVMNIENFTKRLYWVFVMYYFKILLFLKFLLFLIY